VTGGAGGVGGAAASAPNPVAFAGGYCSAPLPEANGTLPPFKKGTAA